jgi:2-polyprenyl-3-methyl-5-hydroxy-6-metoxy-1,4-benzoquinol methylase
MSSSPDPHERQIIGSWHTNAEAWSDAIRAGGIASRVLATDRAIVEAVVHTSPKRVLDIGCGEGWLARKLVERNIAVVGVDAIPALVARAARAAARNGAQGAAEFHILDYAGLAQRKLRCEPCDTAVCNFSLLGNESAEAMLAALPWYLRSGGRLVIQTLHPRAACGEAPYEDGWRAGSWQGFGPEFTDPAPWYFRTMDSWLRMLRRCSFDIKETREPTLPGSNVPASVLFICEVLEVTP